jgi:nucleotide-binding universal stress UspA family protein
MSSLIGVCAASNVGDRLSVDLTDQTRIAENSGSLRRLQPARQRSFRGIDLSERRNPSQLHLSTAQRTVILESLSFPPSSQPFRPREVHGGAPVAEHRSSNQENRMLKRILIDLSDTRRIDGIVRQATDLAERHQAELTVVVEPVLDEQTQIGQTQSIAAAGWARALHHQQLVDTRAQVSAALENLRRLCGVKKVPYTIIDRAIDPFQTIVDLFRFHDLFVCGTDAHFDPTCLGPGCEELIRLVEDGVRPLLAVSGEYRPVKKALIAVSSAIDSSRTLKHYVHLGAWPGAEVKIVTFQGEADPDGLLGEAVAYARQHGIEAAWEALPGTMSQELLPHAVECGADLVALGNTDHSRLARWFFGGAIQEIIRESDRSLFLCR